MSLSGLPHPPSSMSEEQHEAESSYERLTRKFKEEPLVPIGIVGTCAALFAASVSIRRGNQKSANQFFRWRIYAQGFTVLAMVSGSVYYGDTRKDAKRIKDEKERAKAIEARERWLAELDRYEEERLAEVKRMEAKKAARQAAEASRSL